MLVEAVRETRAASRTRPKKTTDAKHCVVRLASKYDLVERGEGLDACLDGVANRQAVQGWLSATKARGLRSRADERLRAIR